MSNPPVPKRRLTRRDALHLGLAAGVATLALPSRGLASETQREPPLLAARVAEKKLPPMAERLPATPRRLNLAALARTPGEYGGDLRLLMADQRDLRMMTIYSYARLVVFNDRLELEPDILERVEAEDSRIFTLVIREGHRWSDGQPFTSEDFRYWWEDVANNKRLSPGGPPAALTPGGAMPVFEVLDARRVRYTWPTPNPAFLPNLAGAQPLFICMPAHYLKRFHERYTDKAALAAAVKARKVKDWGALHERLSRQYRPENPDLPTLDPWRNTTPIPSERFVFERNPYFHRIDERGRQLPYIDRVIMNTATASLIPAKVGAGDSDLQARYIQFDNYTFLKQAEKRQGFQVRLWERADGAKIALFPNLNAADPVWRALNRDVRYRRALSVAINRADINNVIFYGLAKESGNSMLEGSPLFDAAQAKAWTLYNKAQANRLLDEAGLAKRDWDRIRLLPDGRRAELTIEAAGESTEETDALELIKEHLREVGIRVFSRASQREIFRRRILTGDTVMSVWSGLDNAIASADMEPDALAPSNSTQYQWPRFGQHAETQGSAGDRIDIPEVAELAERLEAWRRSASTAEREAVWRRMLAIHAEQVFTIGLVNRTHQPVVVSNRVRNVPTNGWFSFEPGAFFGIHLMDAFWLADQKGD
jgi:peptide/nickel transport system substrate-binding protein